MASELIGARVFVSLPNTVAFFYAQQTRMLFSGKRRDGLY